jgi:hypothetical protein
MKTVFTSQEIAHVWAHKSAPHGKSPGAVSFDGDVIYSYRTAMARHIEHKGKPAIVLNVTSYSHSTSKHQGRINSAIHGLDIPIFRVDGQGMGAELWFSGDELFTHYVENAARCIEQSKLPRIRPHTVEAHKGRAAHYLEQAKAVAAFYGLRKKVDEKAIERLAVAKQRAEKRERIAREKREARDREEQGEAYMAWIENTPCTDTFNPRNFPIAFRVEGDELVSTLGARVPLQAARVAYRFITSKRGQAWRENGETCQVGTYRLNAINEQGIVAGCHRIAWAEIERLSSILA